MRLIRLATLLVVVLIAFMLISDLFREPSPLENFFMHKEVRVHSRVYDAGMDPALKVHFSSSPTKMDELVLLMGLLPATPGELESFEWIDKARRNHFFSREERSAEGRLLSKATLLFNDSKTEAHFSYETF